MTLFSSCPARAVAHYPRQALDHKQDSLISCVEKSGVLSDVLRVAVKILDEAKRRHIVMGKDSSGVASAILYIAGKNRNEQVTRKTIADAADISEVNLRNRQKDLLERLLEAQLTYCPAFLLREVC